MTLAYLALTMGRILYVSPAGDDAADGLSPSHAWKSLARVSRAELQAGDVVELESGATFEGNLEFRRGGSPTSPIIVRSKGKPATIDAKSGPGIAIRTGGIEVRNLRLTGGASSAAKGHVGVLLDAPGDRQCKYVKLEGLEVSNFGAEGISISAPERKAFGFSDVTILKARVHDNYGTGIYSGDGISFNSGNKVFAHRNVVLRDCDVSDNRDGNGIILSGIEGGLVEFCRADSNRGPKGALGMWCWCAKDITFRYCIASRTRGVTDAGGYDIDGGSVGCVIENCLSWDNDGPGGMHCDFPDAPRTQRNAFRNCVSIDDGRKAKGAPCGFGFVVWGSGLYDCTIERTLTVLTKPDQLNRKNGGAFAVLIRLDRVPLTAQPLEGAVFRRNTVEIAAPGYAYLWNDFPAEAKCDLRFEGNVLRGATTTPLIAGGRDQASGFTGSPIQPSKGLPKSLRGFQDLRPRDLPTVFRNQAW